MGEFASHIRLRAAGLTKVYPSGTRALDGASFELQGGRMTALIGPNGAGKSTTLNLLCGLIALTSGTVSMEPTGQRIGWCPQTNLVDWSLTVEENILLGARLIGLSRRQARTETARVMELLDLSKEAGKEAQEVSGGQLRRIQIGRALVGNPDVLVLDEPSSGLDPEGADTVYDYLADRAAAGALVLVSGHDLTVMGQHAHDVLLLEGGVVSAHESLPKFLAGRGQSDLREAYLSGRRAS